MIIHLTLPMPLCYKQAKLFNQNHSKNNSIFAMQKPSLSMEENKGKVCVTGGAGYLASWLVMKLLQHGYSVRATVRSEFEDTTHLKNLVGAPERLEIVDADLRKPESFESTIDGCVGVFHVAHPMNFEAEDQEDAVIRPAVEGALGILQACLKSRTVKRVVYTSSASAVAWSGKNVEVIEENLWTDVEFCKSQHLPTSMYFVSKTLTERAVLWFAEEHGLDVVTILPSLILGPFLIPYFPPSCSTGLALIMGNKDQYKVIEQMQFVHIDDVASAHVFLFECPEAKGRYICSAVDTTIHGLAKFLGDKFPEFDIPKEFLSGGGGEKTVQLSSAKLLGLGFEFKYGLEEMFEGVIQCCKERGFL